MNTPDENVQNGSLSDIITNNSLPLTIYVSRTCTLRDEPVLMEGQTITVLDRKWVHLIAGKNWQNKTFRVKVKNVEEELLSIVEEYYPTCFEEVLNLKPHCDYLQLKKTFKFNFYEFDCYDKFTFNENTEITDTITITQEHTGVSITIPKNLVIDKETFVLVKRKETLKVKELLKRQFKPISIEFEGNLPNVPKGIVRLEQVPIYDVILTVTACNLSRIKYELYPLHLGIQASLFNQLALPSRLSSNKMSEEYRQHLKELEFSMHFDIFDARYYGYVEMEEKLTLGSPTPCVKKTTSIPRNIKKSKSFSDIDRICGEDEPNLGDKHVIKRELSAKEKKKKQNKFMQSFRSKIGSPTREKAKAFPRKSYSMSDDTMTDIDTTDMQFIQSCLSKELGGKEFNPESIIDRQKELLDRYSSSASIKEKISPSSSEFETSNPLYGFDSLPRPERKLMKSSSLPRDTLTNDAYSRRSPTLTSPQKVVKSKQLSSRDEQKRIFASPVTNAITFSHVSPVTPRKKSESEDSPKVSPFPSVTLLEKPETLALNKTNVVDFRGASNFTVGERKQAFRNRQMNNRDPSTDNIISNDSGIDSPDTKKSVESIARSFETISSVEHLRMYFDNGLKGKENKTTNEKPQIASKPRTFAEGRSRSASDPLIDVLVDDKEPKQRPKSLHSHYVPELEDEEGEHLYEAVIYADIKHYNEFKNTLEKREIESYKEIRLYSVDNVIEMLKKINLDIHVDMFREHLVNGQLILDSTEKAFQEMGLTIFESRKLYKYIRGWRPNYKPNIPSVPLDRETRKWSIADVEKSMKLIKLERVGRFCEEHQVDGELLLDLVKTDLMNSLEMHGIKLMEIEWKRLKGFTTKEISFELSHHFK